MFIRLTVDNRIDRETIKKTKVWNFVLIEYYLLISKKLIHDINSRGFVFRLFDSL